MCPYSISLLLLSLSLKSLFVSAYCTFVSLSLSPLEIDTQYVDTRFHQKNGPLFFPQSIHMKRLSCALAKSFHFLSCFFLCTFSWFCFQAFLLKETMQVNTTLFSINELPEVEETDVDDGTKFHKSLRELRDLCSQLHHAADYCENTFLSSEKKRNVVEHTKEYLCRAVVTVVDHLGCVSANLECCLAKNNNISETELRIDCLKQRLGTCQYYSQQIAVTRFYWSASCPKFHPRYLSPPMLDPKLTGGVKRESNGEVGAKHEFEAEEEVPLFLYTCNHKPFLVEDTEKGISCSPNVLPVRHALPSLPKLQNPNFEFQDGRKLKRSILNWKALQTTTDLKSMIIRRGKRTLNTHLIYR